MDPMDHESRFRSVLKQLEAAHEDQMEYHVSRFQSLLKQLKAEQAEHSEEVQKRANLTCKLPRQVATRAEMCPASGPQLNHRPQVGLLSVGFYGQPAYTGSRPEWRRHRFCLGEGEGSSIALQSRKRRDRC